MAQRHLFNGVDIFRLMEDRKQKLKAAFTLPLGSEIDELAMEIKLANDHGLDVPILDETKKYARTREAEVDVSRDPSRHIIDRSRPFYIKGTEINIFVPFTGNPKIFDVKPTAIDMNPPFGDVIGQELVFTYHVVDTSIDINAENARTVGQIKKYLEWLRPSAEQLHVDLRNLVRSLIAQQNRQATTHAQVVNSLRMPIRKDEPPAPKPAFVPKERTHHRRDRWDVFISHASEDKEAIARPLAEALKAKELEVWYDEFSLRVGDSLRQSIDRGLAHSRYGVVILSPHFFEKHWPQQELNGLATKEIGGKKVILPVWHEVNFEEVRQYSPILADRFAVNSKEGLESVVEKLLAAMS